jgi:uncharacterized protein (TIGR04255 family)
VLPNEFERFGKEQKWMARFGELRFNLVNKPSARIQIRNASNDRMIQWQNGRFFYNWLGHGGGEYARYNTIRGEFVPLMDRLRQFIAERARGDFRPNQWEITYVNHLPAGTVWNTPGDWNRVFASSVALPVALPGLKVETFSGDWHYEIEPERGRLHIELQHGREEPEGREPREVLIFKLTSRGPVIPDRDGFDVMSGLDIGHNTIVNSFARLTSAAARAVWEERR